MIFLTVGTHEPFDRLVKAVDEWCAATGRTDQVIGQITGRAGYVPQNFDWHATLDPATYREMCEASDCIVSHAGMGSIITAMSIGKPAVIMPRRGHLNETRNDHQFGTAQKFRDKDGIFVALDETDLGRALDQALAGSGGPSETRTLSPFANASLTDALREFIHRA